MKKILQQIIRFNQIDVQYFRTNLPLTEKIINILRTNLTIGKNFIIHSTPFSPVRFNNREVSYDTPYATKTFLAAVYDFYIETKLLSVLPDDPVIIDVGANIGQYLYAIKSFYPNAQVYCFEPDPEIFILLKKNASQYPKTTLFNCGLGSSATKSTFYKSVQFSEWSTLTPIAGNSYKKIEVEIKRGDDLFVQIKSIDLLKIDVEGAELDVIKGMSKTLHKCRYVLIEVSLARSENSIHTNKLFEFMFANNYHIDHIGRIFSAGVGKEQGAVDILFKNSKH